MTMNQEIQKKKKKIEEKKRVLKSAKNCKMQEKILKIFLKKEFFHIGVMYLKQKKIRRKRIFQIYREWYQL